MTKSVFIPILVILFLVGCSKDKSTESNSNPLVGTWVLSTMKINGTVVDPDSCFDVPVKLILNSNGTGQAWIEDFGHLEDECPIDCIWHTSVDQLVIQLAGEDEGRATYQVTENSLSLLFVYPDDQSTGEFIYFKQ